MTFTKLLHSKSIKSISNNIVKLQVSLQDGTPRNCPARPTKVFARSPVLEPGILAVSSTLLPVLVKRDTTIVPRSTKRCMISVMGRSYSPSYLLDLVLEHLLWMSLNFLESWPRHRNSKEKVLSIISSVFFSVSLSFMTLQTLAIPDFFLTMPKAPDVWLTF